MTPLLTLILQNALGAAVLAILAFSASRVLKNPAIGHALWLVVLLRLIAPPALEWEVLPDSWRPASAVADAAPPTPRNLERPQGWVPFQRSLFYRPSRAELVAPLPTDAFEQASGFAPPRLWSWILPTLGMLVLTGSLVLFAVAIWKIRRFQHLLDLADNAPKELRVRAEGLAKKMGLSQSPRIRIVPASLSPMLWPRFKGAEILLPKALPETLEPKELEAVLAHEMAHAKRRDHWVRHLELTVSILFWWYPLIWWSRRQLRRHEERSCDALVTKNLPNHQSAYARGLLKTLEHLADNPVKTPAIATGAGTTRDLEERLTMILTRTTPKVLSAPQRWLLALTVAALLAVVPGWARGGEESADSPARAEAPAPPIEEAWIDDEGDREWRVEANLEAKEDQDFAAHEEGIEDSLEAEEAYHEQVLALEEQMADLERELMLLRRERRALEHDRHQTSRDLARAASRLSREKSVARRAALSAERHERRALTREGLEGLERRHLDGLVSEEERRQLHESLAREMAQKASELRHMAEQEGSEVALRVRQQLLELQHEHEMHAKELALERRDGMERAEELRREAQRTGAEAERKVQRKLLELQQERQMHAEELIQRHLERKHEKQSLRQQQDRLRATLHRLETSREGQDHPASREAARQIRAEVEALEDLLDEWEELAESEEDEDTEEDLKN